MCVCVCVCVRMLLHSGIPPTIITKQWVQLNRPRHPVSQSKWWVRILLKAWTCVAHTHTLNTCTHTLVARDWRSEGWETDREVWRLTIFKLIVLVPVFLGVSLLFMKTAQVWVHDITFETTTKIVAIYYEAGKKNISLDTSLSICQSVFHHLTPPASLPSSHLPILQKSQTTSLLPLIYSPLTLSKCITLQPPCPSYPLQILPEVYQ